MHLARMREMEHAYSRLVGKAEGKRTLGRTGSRWHVKITLYPLGTGLYNVDCVYLAYVHEQSIVTSTYIQQ
jgi:hypothetical protein